MDVKPIRTAADHKAALRVLSRLIDLDPAPDTPEGEELEVLSLLVEAYEARHYPIEPPTPIEAIRFRMDQQGLTAADLIPLIGTRSRVHEVLNGKRPLAMAMVRRLHASLGIALETLIQEQPRAAA